MADLRQGSKPFLLELGIESCFPTCFLNLSKNK